MYWMVPERRCSMAGFKEIKILLPDHILEELNDLSVSKNCGHHEVINAAMEYYIKGMKRLERLEDLKSGYETMAEINLQYAEVGIESELYALEEYEVRLASGSE